ncbi:MAG: sensor histidine kinase, partial [Mangrovibacterium sp.]
AQVNPHFFMNTLNNIHALIDIDTDRAKDTVIELSKIMRYVLYDANRPLISLEKEIHFLDNYIRLMRIRYTDNLDIRTSYPEEIPPINIPPLLLVTLIENAFKHGVGIRKEAFIHSSLVVENGKLTYVVRNSLSHEKHEASGVGLENLRKRLSLLFKDEYELLISPSEEEYEVKLVMPVG